MTSYVLHPRCHITSLQVVEFPCISQIGIGEKYAIQSLTFGLHLLLAPMTLAIAQTRILNEATATLP